MFARARHVQRPHRQSLSQRAYGLTEHLAELDDQIIGRATESSRSPLLTFASFFSPSHLSVAFN